MPEPSGATMLDLRLVPAALTGWAVTAAGILWAQAGALAAIAISVAMTAAVGWWGSRGRRISDHRALAAGVAAVLLVGGGFAVAVVLRANEVRHHPIRSHLGGVARVVVTPTETPRVLGGGRLMFRGFLLAFDGAQSSGKVVVFAPGTGFSQLIAGQPAAFRAQVSMPNRRDLTVAALAAKGEPALGDAAPIHRAAHYIRDRFGQAARTALPVDQAAMLPALVLGDTSAVPGQTTAAFRTSGLTHLTAVSGANVTIVCGAVLLSAALIGPRAAVGLAAVTLLGFVVVVQPSPSVLRAAVMGAITLLAVLSHRRRQALPALSATVLVLMVADPQLAVDVGFALSASATAALVLIAPAWSQRLTGRGWPRPLADAVSVAVAAQLVTAPLVAGISGSVSLVAVVANLLVAPVIPPITVIGTAAAALCVLWPAGAELLIRFTGPEVWWLLTVARRAANLPAASVPVPSGIAGAACVAVAALATALVWHRWCQPGMTRSCGESRGDRPAPDPG
ncbi:competence protein [Mycolicibacterium cyprinidarum]|uniref:Competence protein n=1 Tax=Mycolicibacterium cyprinidarum TaxID=2860311 RepID=A0ABQ4VDP9_9MYCO|nr:competence protein [Mycolicibacterium sp. NGTWS0302]GJF16122.1 competence protein [Mycolicibacterium sp. NGTWSNA01]